MPPKKQNAYNRNRNIQSDTLPIPNGLKKHTKSRIRRAQVLKQKKLSEVKVSPTFADFGDTLKSQTLTLTASSVNAANTRGQSNSLNNLLTANLSSSSSSQTDSEIRRDLHSSVSTSSDSSSGSSYDSPPFASEQARSRSQHTSPVKPSILKRASADGLQISKKVQFENINNKPTRSLSYDDLPARPNNFSSTALVRSAIASSMQSATVSPYEDENEACSPQPFMVIDVTLEHAVQEEKTSISVSAPQAQISSAEEKTVMNTLANEVRIPSAYATDWLIQERDLSQTPVQIAITSMVQTNTSEILPKLPPDDDIREMYAKNLAFRRSVEHTIRELIATIAQLKNKADLRPPIKEDKALGIEAKPAENEEEHTTIIHYEKELQEAFKKSKDQLVNGGYLRKRVLIVDDNQISQFGTSDKFGIDKLGNPRAPRFIDGKHKPIDYSKAKVFLPQCVGFDAYSHEELKRVVNFYIKLGVPAANIVIYVSEYNNVLLPEDETVTVGNKHYADWNEENQAWLQSQGVAITYQADIVNTVEYKRAMDLVLEKFLLDKKGPGIQLRSHMRKDAKDFFTRTSEIKIKVQKPAVDAGSPTLVVPSIVTPPLQPETTSPQSPPFAMAVQEQVSPLNLGLGRGTDPSGSDSLVLEYLAGSALKQIAAGMYEAKMSNSHKLVPYTALEEKESDDKILNLLTGAAVKLYSGFGVFESLRNKVRNNNGLGILVDNASQTPKPGK